MQLVYLRLIQGWNKQNVSAKATYIWRWYRIRRVYKLDAGILEIGYVFQNLLSTDL